MFTLAFVFTNTHDHRYVASLSDSDHRKFNAAGQYFDKGESWSGLGECLEDVAMPAVEGFKKIVAAAKERGELAADVPLSQVALRWCLDHDGVTCVIPGARTVEQVLGNVGTSAVPRLSKVTHAAVKQVYAEKVQTIVEPQW
jgi:aryl-alcohol dehydrogenase-like predicted oxidoreductase